MDSNNKYARYIKNKDGTKVPMKPSSVNLTEDHKKYLERRNYNLSKLVRDMLDRMMEEEEKAIDEL